MATGRRGFLIAGAGFAVGGGLYAWLRARGYDIDPRLDVGRTSQRAKSAALTHEPFDAAAQTTLLVLVDDLLPKSEILGLPSGSEASVFEYMIAAAKAPGFHQVRADVLKLLRHLDLVARQESNRRFTELNPEERQNMLSRVASGQLERRSFPAAPALELTLRLALEGYLGHPHHGGNPDAKTWSALQIDMPRERIAVLFHGAGSHGAGSHGAGSHGAGSHGAGSHETGSQHGGSQGEHHP